MPSSLSAKRDVESMVTKMMLTGNESRAIWKLQGSSFTAPTAPQTRTNAAQTAHWKNSSEIGDSNPKLLSVAFVEQHHRRRSCERQVILSGPRCGKAYSTYSLRWGAVNPNRRRLEHYCSHRQLQSKQVSSLQCQLCQCGAQRSNFARHTESAKRCVR